MPPYRMPTLPDGSLNMEQAMKDALALVGEGLPAVADELRAAAVEQVHETSPVAGMLRLNDPGSKAHEMGDRLALNLDRLRRACWAMEVLLRSDEKKP